MKKQSMTKTKLQCTECKSIFELFRKTRKQKKFGHIKNLYCFNCKKITKHIELKNEYIGEMER